MAHSTLRRCRVLGWKLNQLIAPDNQTTLNCAFPSGSCLTVTVHACKTSRVSVPVMAATNADNTSARNDERAWSAAPAAAAESTAECEQSRQLTVRERAISQ